MAPTNRERVGRALELLQAGLSPWVEREMEAVHKDRWLDMARQAIRDDRAASGDFSHWDISALVSVILSEWNRVFRYALGSSERNYVHEIRDVRNAWAHQGNFSSDDTARALDTMKRLLSTVSAPQAEDLDRMLMELQRLRFEEQARQERRRVSTTPIQGSDASGYKTWREIVAPQPDVARGRYQQAEFAADLGQVHRGEATSEYGEPEEFFQRTYITEGLRHLLSNALRRLNGDGGDPVVELQTNFGGGKTHSMLALYHLFSGKAAGELAGIEGLVDEVGGFRPLPAKRAVLVGTALSPADPRKKPDGTVTHSLWGELAWQLGGKQGYALVQEGDKRGVSPGSDLLRELLKMTEPALILIDEWVAFLRNIYRKSDLPAGDFEANLTFVQALTEAVKASPKTLLVASLPASQIEIGGEGGAEALERLAHTFGRVESAWRPASTEESFEIVRRRLFEPLDAQLARSRDAAIRAFIEVYRQNPGDFPPHVKEGEYERRMRATYPVHPELFDRLFNDWSTLERFQQTRGVLRLMSAVIHQLWERQDPGHLILPASVPIDSGPVQYEIKQYLEDQWVPVIGGDVDGPNSLPLRQDQDNPNLGRFSASRRVARTVFIGSAPTHDAAHRGIDDRQIKLGCVQPGESVAIFGDALRRLSGTATFLYADSNRYWFSTQQNVNQVARDRAARVRDDEVWEEIARRLREEARQRAEFARVHPVPGGAGDVPDDEDVKLVILGPDHPHVRGSDSSPARVEANSILDSRGSAPRTYRNTLVFLAADRTRLEELEQTVREFLAWKSIQEEEEQLNLDQFQRNQARSKRSETNNGVAVRLPECYCWVLAPDQADPRSDMTWEEIRVQGQDGLVSRVAKRLKNDELLVTRLAGSMLRAAYLDRIPLWEGDHVSTRKLAEYFASYVYLPRLAGTHVLQEAIVDGLAQITWESDGFAYAEGWDEERNRYIGLKLGGQTVVDVGITKESLLVKPDVALAQVERESPSPTPEGGGGEKEPVGTPEGGAGEPGEALEPGAPTVTRRFHGSVQLDQARPARDAGVVAQEVIQHLTALLGAKVKITLEIQGEFPDGVPDGVIRTVSENCRTLKFETFGFEEE